MKFTHFFSKHRILLRLCAVLILTISALATNNAAAERYTYPSGRQIVTLRGLSLNLTQFNAKANGYIPDKGGNDFIIMEQFNRNCGPNSVQMVLYYYRNHRRLKDIWAAGDIHTVAFGTWPDELRRALNELDVPTHWYTEKTLEDVRRYIRNNRPPILLLRRSNTGYHWVVAVGYDTQYDKFLIADPQGRFQWWESEKLQASWDLRWQAAFNNKESEWYEFQIDVGPVANLTLTPNTVVVPLEPPAFERRYHAYWTDTQAIEIYGAYSHSWGETRTWEETVTFDNPFVLAQVSDIELVSSTATARLDRWERVGDSSIRLWGEVEDGFVLRGRMWVIVRTFYLNNSAVAPAATAPPLTTETALLPNYPNPFNPETWIPYQLAEPADVTVSIYAADGKLVRTLELGHQPAGIYQSRSLAAHWDGRNAQGEQVASGVYFYTFTAGDFTATGKMLVRK